MSVASDDRIASVIKISCFTNAKHMKIIIQSKPVACRKGKLMFSADTASITHSGTSRWYPVIFNSGSRFTRHLLL